MFEKKTSSPEDQDLVLIDIFWLRPIHAPALNPFPQFLSGTDKSFLKLLTKKLFSAELLMVTRLPPML